MQITYITGNFSKVKEAQVVCRNYSIEVYQQKVLIDEIQAASIHEIAADKARKAYQEIGSPVVVNDVGWEIPALSGFPGPYMAYINEWFTDNDFLRLMEGTTDRRIFLIEVLAYCDENGVQEFECKREGTILHESRGTNGAPSDKVVSFNNNLTIAEEEDRDGFQLDDSQNVWRDFCNAFKVS
jgi:XTP/dITP diphosphohydrolase